jgi:hypothetical protein
LADDEAITVQEPFTGAAVAAEVISVQTMKLYEKM